jgi:hypothetical protein
LQDVHEVLTFFGPQPLPAPPSPKPVRYTPLMPNGRRNNGRKRPRSAGVRWAQARETFWDYAAQEAIQRVGRGSQLKGVIHEVAIREKRTRPADASVPAAWLSRRSRTFATSLPTARYRRIRAIRPCSEIQIDSRPL